MTRSACYFASLVLLATLAAPIAVAPAAAQQRIVASTLALVRLPVPSFAWMEDPEGAKAMAVEADAAEFGATCTPAREYHAWQVTDGDAAMAIYDQTNAAFEAAGWQIRHGADRQDGSEPMLATRNGASLALGWYPLLDREALGLLICEATVAGDAAAPAQGIDAAPVAAPAADPGPGGPAVPETPRIDAEDISDGGAVMVAVAVLFIFLGGGLGGWARYQRSRAKASLSWVEVPARILSSYMVTQEDTDSEGDPVTWYVPKVRYAYDVGGHTYEADRIHFGNVRRGTDRDAMAVVERYPAGATTSARVDPADPRSATLETRQAGSGFMMIIALTFIAMGIFTITLAE